MATQLLSVDGLTAKSRLKVTPGTGTASSNAVTVNAAAGVITTEALSTAAGATYTCTLSSSKIEAGDMVFATVDPNGSAGTPILANVAVSAGQAVIIVKNDHASAALDSAVKIYFFVLSAGTPS